MKINPLCFLLALSGFMMLSIGLGAQEVSIQVGNTTRKMIIHAPSGIEANRPLIISMHGLNQTMYDQKNQTQFGSVAEANKFVLVYPQAIDNSWQLWGTGDTDFILAIIDEMHERYSIDRDRVYVSGFSMGGMMSYYALTQIADKITAIAPVSGFLMGGPNTNSSRPVPIIHVHGAGDDFVPHSRVMECMDAWSARNGCPVTPQLTDPYPADKPSSTSKKYYWEPGDEGVEMVFISVGGVGHWYSDDPNGIFTSQEIWDFCKKFSLKLGVPQFGYASVKEDNPKQVKVTLSEPINDSIYFDGFTMKVDDQIAAIDSIVLGDTNQLIICMTNDILNSNDLTLSYADGNVVSTLGKRLLSFTDTLVDNLLKGASPRLMEVTTNDQGDVLLAKFNMKMQVPSDVSALTLIAEFNGQKNIPVLQGSFFDNDSTMLSFSLDEQVYRDYELLFTYSGTNIISVDNGLLMAIADFPVKNLSDGLPVQFISGKMKDDGITTILEFSKPMLLEDTNLGDLTLERNGENVTFKNYSVFDNAIELTLSESVHYSDNVTISYVPGSITAADHGPLEEFSDVSVDNPLSEPDWFEVPCKIEAEDYTFKSGMQTETTGDDGGGLNLGYIGDGDWLEYAIENGSTNTDYQISFRLAAQGNGGIIDFYVDEVSAGSITVQSTGGWQVYTSVVKPVSITGGKHYLKVVATKAGFNFNYMEITGEEGNVMSAVSAENTDIAIYPNPVSHKLTIRSEDFLQSKVEIINMTGETVLLEFITNESEIKLPVNLASGVYLVRISNEKRYQFTKIFVNNGY